MDMKGSWILIQASEVREITNMWLELRLLLSRTTKRNFQVSSRHWGHEKRRRRTPGKSWFLHWGFFFIVFQDFYLGREKRYWNRHRVFSAWRKNVFFFDTCPSRRTWNRGTSFQIVKASLSWVKVPEVCHNCHTEKRNIDDDWLRSQ